jgi:hypothetical protein
MFTPCSKLSATIRAFLFRRPPALPTLPRDQLHPAIRSVFLPGIKHGICHHLTSNTG